MRITLGTTQYRWTPGTRTINVWTDTPYTAEQAGWPLSRWLETDVISFGYDKPDNTTTQIEALDALLTRLIDDGMMRHPAGKRPLEVNLCGDCIYFDANGWGVDEKDGPLPTPAPMSRLEDHLISPNETDHVCEGHFSWSPCDGCGCTDAGTRYCYVAVTK